MDQGVVKKFELYPGHIRPKMAYLRELIFDVASNTEGVGELEETLKWGEPAYLTQKTKSGTTIRIDWKERSPNQYALYVNCKTNLIDTFRSLFSKQLTFEGNRAIIFPVDQAIPENELRLCIKMALRYHLDKK